MTQRPAAVSVPTRQGGRCPEGSPFSSARSSRKSRVLRTQMAACHPFPDAGNSLKDVVWVVTS